MDDKEDLSLEHDWECDKKCNSCEMQELCEKNRKGDGAPAGQRYIGSFRKKCIYKKMI